jgi:hypothetical protein
MKNRFQIHPEYGLKTENKENIATIKPHTFFNTDFKKIMRLETGFKGYPPDARPGSQFPI